MRRYKITKKSNNIPQYHIFGKYSVVVEDQYDEDEHFNDLEKAIEVATKNVQEDGREQYILKIVKVIEPVKVPYEVEVKNYENEGKIK
jgi:hypothetical protein